MAPATMPDIPPDRIDDLCDMQNAPNAALVLFMAGNQFMANEVFAILSDTMKRLFPIMRTDDTLAFLQMQLAASIGIYTMTDLSDIQREVLDMPEFRHFNIDYATVYETAVAHVLRGILEQAGHRGLE